VTYFKQETKFTCGPASVRNSLVAMGYTFSERKIRNLAGTNRNNGTSEKKIFKALHALGFRYKEFHNKSDRAFKQRITYNMKKGNKLIVLTDHEDHWISVVDYSNKILEVVDPERKRVKMQMTPTELSKWCLNFNKRTKNTYYFGIIIYKPQEDV
jgi:ABC-type bacteriocin/lantibiotic exporter with double-glycine peptidase domain